MEQTGIRLTTLIDTKLTFSTPVFMTHIVLGKCITLHGPLTFHVKDVRPNVHLVTYGIS